MEEGGRGREEEKEEGRGREEEEEREVINIYIHNICIIHYLFSSSLKSSRILFFFSVPFFFCLGRREMEGGRKRRRGEGGRE